jgi:hypothetical protein
MAFSRALSTDLGPPHDLDLVSNPDDQDELLPETMVVVGVFDQDVSERCTPRLEIRREFI